MTTQEFSNSFDVLINRHSLDTQNALNFDEYEKSQFLTKAQNYLIISIYNGKNNFLDSFEKTEEVRRYISELVSTYTTTTKVTGQTGLSDNSTFFNLPSDLWFITYEQVVLKDYNLSCSNQKIVSVYPVTQDEYFRINNNPFRKENQRRVLRLDIQNNRVELISDYNIDTYLCRYITKPSPIILTDLDDGLSIDGLTSKTECKLNSAIHETILQKAVELALQSRVHNNNAD